MICRTLKKGVIGAALGAGALGLIFGTSAPSYVKTTFHKARNTVKGSVPIEFEIERAKQEIGALDPAISGAIEALVKAQIEAEHLQRDIASTRDEMNTEGRALQALNEHLKTGDLHLTGGVAYSAKEVKNDLVRRMDHYKIVKTLLTEKQETLNILQKNVLSAKEGLSAMQNARRDLSARVDGAEAKLNQIKAARTSNEFNFDDSAVGQAKKTVTELEMKLEQMARVDDLKGKYADRAVSVTVDSDRDVAKEIDAEFSSAPTSSDKAAHEKF